MSIIHLQPDWKWTNLDILIYGTINRSLTYLLSVNCQNERNANNQTLCWKRIRAQCWPKAYPEISFLENSNEAIPGFVLIPHGEISFLRIASINWTIPIWARFSLLKAIKKLIALSFDVEMGGITFLLIWSSKPFASFWLNLQSLHPSTVGPRSGFSRP